MAYQEDVDDARRILFVRTSGALGRELGPLAAASRARAKALGYGLLFDFRAAAPDNCSIVDTVNWFGDFYDPIDPTLKHVRTAHLVRSEDAEHFRFIETALVNRGGVVKMFLDESAAVDWLLSTPGSEA